MISMFVNLASIKQANCSSARACSDSCWIYSRINSGRFLYSETMFDTLEREILNSLARSLRGSQPRITLSAISSF